MPSPAAVRALYARVFLVSFTLLFLEILLIRWIPAEVRAISYYKNVLLMAAFLGLGVGCLSARRRFPTGWLYPVGVGLVVGATFYFAEHRVEPGSQQETLIWVLYLDLSEDTRRFGVETVSVIFFALTAVPFAALGKNLGEAIAALPPLPAYTVNILASLLGTLAFAALSACSTPPIWWFAVLTAASILSFLDRPADAILTALVLGGLLVPIARLDRESRWSPYYKIDRIKTDLGFSISVNGSFHQHALPLTDRRSDKMAALFQRYAIWSDFKPAADRALVLGAGTGNDVAVLLDRGVKEIDAVEIDPVILDLGVEGHPSKPYQSPRVNRIVQDARRFLRETDRTYDLIVFGTLDSHTLLSGLAAIRLDSFLYTRECFAAVKARLAPGGVLALYYSAGEPWLIDKLYATIKAGFGAPPLEVMPKFSPGVPLLFSVVFLAGDPIREKYGEACAAQDAKQPADVATPTDDWPNLYLRRPGIPSMYASALGVILGLSIAAVLLSMPRGGRRPLGFYFFMGAGFLLLETKSITDLALIFGTTWIVSAVVISAILGIILVANLLAARGRGFAEGPPGARAARIAALLGALALGGVVSPGLAFDSVPAPWGSYAAVALCLAPVLAAAWLYASVYRGESEPERAFGSNLLGAMLGGAVEYGSMAVGNRALVVVALAFYGAAAAFAWRGANRMR